MVGYNQFYLGKGLELRWCSDTILMAVKPLLSVLDLTDGEEKPSVGYIYDTMEKIKRSIMVALDNRESEYMPYLMVEKLHSPLHAAPYYYLNPSVFYSASFPSNKVIQGLLDCIETLEPGETPQVMITSNISFSVEGIGDFGRPVALRGREGLAPGHHLVICGQQLDYPELQRLAVRCDRRRWSRLERSYSKNKNRLEHQRWNELLFVHYNLRLQER